MGLLEILYFVISNLYVGCIFLAKKVRGLQGLKGFYIEYYGITMVSKFYFQRSGFVDNVSRRQGSTVYYFYLHRTKFLTVGIL
jgi:hypothetical protein